MELGPDQGSASRSAWTDLDKGWEWNKLRILA